MMSEFALPSEQGLVCLKCGSVVKNKGTMKTHMRDKHVNAHLKYRCPVCQRVYGSRNSIANHLSTAHKMRGIDVDRLAV